MLRWRSAGIIVPPSLREERKSHLVASASIVVVGDTCVDSSRPVDAIRGHASDVVED